MADYSATIQHASARYGVPANILTALLRQESGLREGVTSNRGAQDIAQFEPATAREYGVTLGDNNPTDDIMGAAHYLHDNLKRTGGDIKGALSIYNSGSPTGYTHIPETENYVTSILKMAGEGGGSSSGPSTQAGQDPSYTAVNVPSQADPQAKTAALLQWMSTRGQPGSLGSLLQGLQAAKGTPSTQLIANANTPDMGANANTSAKGAVADPSGKEVAAWIEPILAYARKQGWGGTINSGYRSLAQQTQIYNSGVRPAAKPGTSNHEFTAYPGGAIDVSDAATLSKILQSSPYAKTLVWAGGKDPVHFSHPHNGSY